MGRNFTDVHQFAPLRPFVLLLESPFFLGKLCRHRKLFLRADRTPGLGRGMGLGVGFLKSFGQFLNMQWPTANLQGKTAAGICVRVPPQRVPAERHHEGLRPERLHGC